MNLDRRWTKLPIACIFLTLALVSHCRRFQYHVQNHAPGRATADNRKIVCDYRAGQ